MAWYLTSAQEEICLHLNGLNVPPILSSLTWSP